MKTKMFTKIIDDPLGPACITSIQLIICRTLIKWPWKQSMQQRAMPTGTPEQNDNKKESVQRDFVVEYIRYSGFLLRQKNKIRFFQPSSSSSVETYSKNLIIMFSSQYKLSWINSFETKWVWLSDSKVATLLGLFLNLICNQGNSTTVHTLTVLERRWF